MGLLPFAVLVKPPLSFPPSLPSSTMSKITRDTYEEAIKAVLKGAQEKKRNFRETVELQVMLKNYDPARDNRFSGTNFLVSLLKKNWQNVRSLNVKSTMGAPQRLM